VTPDTDQLEPEPTDLTLEEIQEQEEAESDASPITYSGTDFDAEGLVRRYERGDIVVPNFGHDDDDSIELAPFQRGFVWRKPQMDRFIESLLLGFPIPGIMLVEQADKRYLVLDGQQRIKTLAAFKKGIHDKKQFSLQNVAEEFKGLTYETLAASQKRMLENTFISATIVRSDRSPQSLEAVYQVFERLNSGGTQLTPHEIRIALYSGDFVKFLADLNKAPGWRDIYGPESLRLRDQELILRILALYSRGREYVRPMKQFLNRFISDHRYLNDYPTDEIKKLFEESTRALADANARQVLRRQGQRINAALLETVVIGCMQRTANGLGLERQAVEAGLQAVSDDTALILSATAGTTGEENVQRRLTGAASAFAA